jgi:hypothetical protein
VARPAAPNSPGPKSRAAAANVGGGDRFASLAAQFREVAAPRDTRRGMKARARAVANVIASLPGSACVDVSSQSSRKAWLRSSAAVRGPDDAVVVR